MSDKGHKLAQEIAEAKRPEHIQVLGMINKKIGLHYNLIYDCNLTVLLSKIKKLYGDELFKTAVQDLVLEGMYKLDCPQLYYQQDRCIEKICEYLDIDFKYSYNELLKTLTNN